MEKRRISLSRQAKKTRQLKEIVYVRNFLFGTKESLLFYVCFKGPNQNKKNPRKMKKRVSLNYVNLWRKVRMCECNIIFFINIVYTYKQFMQIFIFFFLEKNLYM